MTDVLRLEQARAALHQLLIGESVTVIQKDGKKVDYQPADVVKLRGYIAELEGKTGANRSPRRPAGVTG